MREPSFTPSNSFSGQRHSQFMPEPSFVEFHPRYSLGDPATDREIGYPNSLQMPIRNSAGLLDSSESINSSSSSQSNSNQPSETHYMESLIDIESVQNGTNTRLTVMLRNVPNRYTEDDLKRVLDLTIPDQYRVVNFLIDTKTRRNLGYAFIAVNDNASLLKLYNSMHNVYWPNCNKKKVCRICNSIDKKGK